VIVGSRLARQSHTRREETVLRPLLIVTAAFFALLGAPTAQASGLLSGVLPGLVSPSDTPDVCDTSVGQPFARWGDNNYYVLVPGGAFEDGGAGWKLSGGAKVVRGNESFYVHAAADRYSLDLPDGSSATSPPMCFAPGDWHFRFFAADYGTVRVKVVVKSLLGIVSTLDGGTVKAGSTWRPSPDVELALTNICGILATDSVSIRLTPTGGSDLRVDDIYLDPWRSL
jgi:hypothetical protein